MRRPYVILTVEAVLAFVLSTCTLRREGCEESTEPSPPPPPTSSGYQVPGPASQVDKDVDSCFSYEFPYFFPLKVDFCATGNCCPDSNRFSFNFRVTSDSVIVTIADTAAQKCFCTSTYVLHVEFRYLPNETYWFVCERRDYSPRTLLYAERVYRH
jgi:hypothetical protein